jgi:hypothetical protein
MCRLYTGTNVSNRKYEKVKSIDPGGTRTHNLQIRSLLPCPIRPRGRSYPYTRFFRYKHSRIERNLSHECMTTEQYRTIFYRDLHKYPEWDVKERFHESAIEPYCARSGDILEHCKEEECLKNLRNGEAKDVAHRVRSRVTRVEKAIIVKKDQITVP